MNGYGWYWYPLQRSSPFNMRLILVGPPAVEPLTSDEVRARLNISTATMSDEVVNAYIMSARQQIDGADGWLGRSLITQTWLANFDQWPTTCGGRIDIPLPPLQSVSSITYLDSTGTPVTVDPSTYQVVMGPRPYVLPAWNTSWPAVSLRPDAISMTFVSGYGDDGPSVPEPIRTAISMMVANYRMLSARNPMVTMEQEEGIGQTRYDPNPTFAKTAIDDAVEALLSTYQVIDTL